MADDFTQIVSVKVWKSGLWEVVREQTFDTIHLPPPKRTDSRKWSKKSRKRLIARIAKSEIKMQSMITLTFPDRCRINDGKIAKMILNRFLVKLRRKYPAVEYWWVLEFQTNGQPHWHVMTSVPNDQINRPWLGSAWAQSILYRAPESWAQHRALAEDIYKVHAHKEAWFKLKKEDGAQRYLLSYVGKESQKEPPSEYVNIGRWWGCSKGLSVEPSEAQEWPIDEATLRDVLITWGLDWVASWEYLPRYIHVPPGAGIVE